MSESTFREEVAGRFGVLPNFFCSAPATAGLIEQLWIFAKSAYLDNPLPSLLKERLFVHLSRVCNVRYCIVRHVGFLIGEGRPAGDPSVIPQTIEDALTLLRRRMPDDAALAGVFNRLNARSPREGLPSPGTKHEYDLLDALTVIFIAPSQSARARDAVRHAVGAETFELLAAFLSFVRTAHYWTETHPDLDYEPDMRRCMERNPELARLLLNTAEAEHATGNTQLRDALRESEERLGLAIEIGELASWDWNLRSGAVTWNDRHFLLQGYAVDEVTPNYEAWLARVHPDDRNETTAKIERARDTGQPYSHVFRTLHPDGTIRWCSARAHFFYDAQGAPYRMIGVMEDVTERKLADEALRQSEERQTFLLHLSDALRPLGDAEEIRLTAARVLGQRVGASRVAYAENIGDELFDITRNYVNGGPEVVGRFPYAAFGSGVLSDLKAGRMRVQPDINREQELTEAERRTLRDAGVGASLNVPLVKDGQLVAFLGIYYASPHNFTQHEINLATDVAERTWASVERARAEAALTEEFRYTKILQDLSARLVTEENIQTVYEEILSAVIEITRATAGTVQMLDAETGELVILAARGFSQGTREYVETGSITSSGPAPRAGDRACFNFDPVSADIFVRRQIDEGLLSAQSMPLVSRSGRPIGMVSTHWAELGHRLSERELRFLNLLARQAADLIEQRQADSALRDSERRLAAELCGTQLLQRLSTRLIPEQSPEVLHEQIMDAALELMQADAVSIQLLSNDGQRLRRLATRNLHPKSTEYWTWVDASHASTCGQALRTNRRMMTEDVETSAELVGTGDLEAFRWSGTRAVQSTPLVSRSGRPIGMISTHWHKSRRLDESDFGLFDILARQVADLLERSAADAALRDSEERYHALFSASPVPFMVIAPNPPDFTILAANDAYLASTLMTREGLIGRRLFNVFTDDPSRPGDKGPDALALSLDRVLTLKQADAMVRTRYDIERPDGKFEPHWWLAINAPLLDASGQVTAIIHQVTRVTELHLAEEAERHSQERQRVLVQELQHRTRNLLGVVRSITNRTLEASNSLDDFSESFRERLAALARVNGLLSRLAEGDRITFDELIRTELSGHGIPDEKPGEGQVRLSGPQNVRLRSSSVQTLALGLHELTTNAIKYGALSKPEGRLSIRWSVQNGAGEQRLKVDWQESGVSPDLDGGGETHRKGYGRELIEQALPYQLKAETTYEITPDGVRCSISLPISTAQ